MKKRIVLSMTIILILVSGCTKPPIKIGYIADLSTTNSQLGIDARNAVELYIRALNESGGIKGREVQLVIKDDKADPEYALSMHNEFKKEDVQFVLGHLVSSMYTAVNESASEDLLFVSPSMSTTNLTGIDDFFLRTSPVNDLQADAYVQYAVDNKIENLLILYDTINENYTRTVAERIQDLYAENNLKHVTLMEFNSSNEDIDAIYTKIQPLSYDNLFVLAQSTTSAYIFQYAKRDNPDIGTFSVSWSMTNDFIENGGEAVKGTIFVGIHKPASPSASYQAFVDSYTDYYNTEPTFISMLAYDAIDVLCQGLEQASELTPVSVKDTILEFNEFNGLQETFSIDDFGDASRKYQLYILDDNEFVPLQNN